MDGPLGARGRRGKNLIWVEGVRVSGLLVRRAGRWPRWVPRSTPKRKSGLEGLRPTRVLWILGSTDDHLFPCQPFTRRPRRSDRGRRWPIRLIARRHGPRDAGHLVGPGGRRDLARTALEQLLQPRRRTGPPRPARVLHHRGGPHHQQLTQPFIASSANTKSR